jgi:hypothetical protein
MTTHKSKSNGRQNGVSKSSLLTSISRRTSYTLPIHIKQQHSITILLTLEIMEGNSHTEKLTPRSAAGNCVCWRNWSTSLSDFQFTFHAHKLEMARHPSCLNENAESKLSVEFFFCFKIVSSANVPRNLTHFGGDRAAYKTFPQKPYFMRNTQNIYYSPPSINVNPREWIKVNIYRGVNS